MVFGWLLLLVMALSLVTRGTKDCIFYDLTESLTYPGINKDCILSTPYEHHEEPVTYKLISICHYGELCKRAPAPADRLKAGITTGRMLRVLLLLQ
ncbi:sperm acrosome membrane-associated protein 4-like [Pipistrellus kuhlii]|uniref:sperm acrosome membrane-associated protein 4-like n=1 Tax=Pipistrellus kuhlii TaxID=59472 RepID=UPI00174ECF9B|nr:sperm acrosome membrane-associated protein 4-like [Pipistrellus kuhlii]